MQTRPAGTAGESLTQRIRVQADRQCWHRDYCAVHVRLHVEGDCIAAGDVPIEYKQPRRLNASYLSFG